MTTTVIIVIVIIIIILFTVEVIEIKSDINDTRTPLSTPPERYLCF